MKEKKSPEAIAKWKESKKATKDKRNNQEIFIRELKIDKSKLNSNSLQFVQDIFNEAKWLKNNAIKSGIFTTSDKLKELIVHEHLPDGHNCYSLKYIKNLASQSQQAVITGLKTDVIALAAKKAKDMKVGRIKFTNEVNSIDFPQINVSYHLRYTKGVISHIKLAKNAQWFKVKGGKQLRGVDEIANIKLIQKPSGIYFHITCCVAKERFDEWKASYSKVIVDQKLEVVGCDLGIKTAACISDNQEIPNRTEFDIRISENKQIRKLQRKRCKLLEIIKKSDMYKNNKSYRTKGYIKILKKLRIQYERLSNSRKEKAKQFVSHVSRRYEMVVFQDEMIKNWHKGLFGKQVQHSALGTVKSGLKQLVKKGKGIMLAQSMPTTKECPVCRNKTMISLAERTFVCDHCGYTDHRDFKSADTMMVMAGYSLNKLKIDEKYWK